MKVQLIIVLLFCLVVGDRANRFRPGSGLLSWSDALETCNKSLRTLPDLHTDLLNRLLAIKARQNVIINKDKSWNRIWLIGYRKNMRSPWMKGGTNGTRLFLLNFDKTARQGGNCIEMYLQNNNTFLYNWVTDDCNAKKHFFCHTLEYD